MVNWKEIHPDFIPLLRELWERKNRGGECQGFTAEQTQQWINRGLNPTDYDFALYLKRNSYNPSQILNLKALKEEHKKNLDWEDIHSNFAEHDFGEWTGDGVTYYYQFWDGITYPEAKLWIQEGFVPEEFFEVRQWIKFNFTASQARAWANIGLNRDYDAEFAAYLRDNGYTPATAFQEKGYAQIWLDWKYPQEQRYTVKELNTSFKNFTGTLDLSDFVNLESLNCTWDQLTGLKLDNCLKLKELDCSVNKIQQDLSFLSSLVNLEKLNISSNHFFGSLEPLQNLSKLKELYINNTDIDSGLEYLPDNIENFSCFSTGEENKCQAIYNLFANDQGAVETEENKWFIKNFPQKLQEYKQKWERDNPAKALDLQKEKNKTLIISLKALEEKIQMEREEAEKALNTAKEWKERQIKELKEEKDKQIDKLKAENVLLQRQLTNRQAQIQHNPFKK